MADSSSSETNVPVSEWTTGTLKIYHDDKINSAHDASLAEIKRVDANIIKLNILLDERSISQEKAVNAALMAAQEAVNKSDSATEKRFEGVNEFRKTLADQAALFMPRAEFMASNRNVEDKLTDLTNRFNKTEGQTKGGADNTARIYAFVGVVGTILAIIVLLANGVFK